jgi:hypothetical protein
MMLGCLGKSHMPLVPVEPEPVVPPLVPHLSAAFGGLPGSAELGTLALSS